MRSSGLTTKSFCTKSFLSIRQCLIPCFGSSGMARYDAETTYAQWAQSVPRVQRVESSSCLGNMPQPLSSKQVIPKKEVPLLSSSFQILSVRRSMPAVTAEPCQQLQQPYQDASLPVLIKGRVFGDVQKPVPLDQSFADVLA